MSNAPSAHEHLRAFASRIERLDAEIKDRNTDKKEVYAEMKAHGFDVKRFKVAHRKHVAMTDDPVGTQEADAIVDLYLSALQGADTPETKSGANLAQLRGHPEKPSRARTENTLAGATLELRTSEAAGDADGASTVSPADQSENLQNVIPLAAAGQVAEGAPAVETPSATSPEHPEMPEMPNFLRRDRATATEYFAAG